MKKLITLLFTTFAGLAVFGQVSEISGPAGNDFTYDGATLHHYGVGFHNYLDEQDGVNLYGSGYFGIDLFTGGVHRFRISRYGNVGIGTTKPQAKLHINNGDNSYGAILAQATESAFQLYIKTLTTNPINTEVFKFGLKYNENENNGFISFYRGGADFGGYLGFSTNGIERIRVTTNGNVGIGTETPNSKLQIGAANGDGIFIGKNNDVMNWNGTGAQPGYSIRFAGYRDCFDDVTGAKISALRTNLWGGGGDSRVQGMELAFYVCNQWAVANGDGALTEALRIKSNGFVGIGTDKPDEMLTVKGKIHAREILVDYNGALVADFVFAPSYILKPLAEVEAFVKENKHLPEIPSAAEVAENGINLGDMQNKLLQKVEELTLYAIELEKSRNEEIKKRVELEARLAKIETLLLQK